jgi:hypothetical protein
MAAAFGGIRLQQIRNPARKAQTSICAMHKYRLWVSEELRI